MSHPAFPVDADISSLLTTSGITLPTGFTVAGYGALAQAEFQNRTGQIPFLKDVSDVARTFDPPGPNSNSETSFYKGGEKVLELDAGLLSVTSIALGVTADNPTGTVLDLQRQVRTMPLNAPTRGLPYTWLEFYFPVYGAASSIVVTGKWGYSATVPEDVWQACVRIGAGIAAKDILQGIFASPTTVKNRDKAVTQDSFRDLGTAWENYAALVISRYKLLRLGL